MEEIRLINNPAQFENIYSRETVKVPSTVNREKRTIRGVIATELPAIVFDWARWEPIREILLVKGANLPEKVPMLDSHSRFTVANIKGSVMNFKQENNYEKFGDVITADHIFSSLANRELTLAEEGHLDSTSIGYRVYPNDSVSIMPNQEIEIDGKIYKNDFGDDMNLVIRKRWDLLENSLVSIGADKAAKFRSIFNNEFEIKSQGDEKLLNEIEKAKEEINKLKITIERSALPMKEETQETINEGKDLAEKTRKENIEALTRDFKDKVKGVNLDQMQSVFLNGGKSAGEYSDYILKNIANQTSVNKPEIDLTNRETKQYSLARAMRSIWTGEKCMESEISHELSKRYGPTKGILVPHSVLSAQRDLLAGTATAAAELVATEHLAGEFIELLRNKMVFAGLGVRMLTGLQGNIEIPKWATASTFGWAATEAADTSESTPATTEVTMSPKRGGAYVEVSKTLLLQSSPSVDMLLTDDISKVIALAIDAAIAHGSGSSGQPTGIVSTSNVGSFSAASLDWPGVLDAIADVETANADVPNMAWVTYPSARATLKARAKEAGYPVYLVSEDNVLGGYPILATNQVSSGYLIFGDYSQVILGMWGVLDLTIDPYSKAEYGLVRYVAQQLIDLAVRQPGAFTVASDFS